jgi:dTMP kinase
VTPTGPHRAGLFISVDGPGGVGKSTVVALLGEILQAKGLAAHATTQPSRTPLGDHIRHGTHTYRNMALACLVAGDRHHQLATEILPALESGAVVVCDRYLPSSLVLQRLDGLTARTVWELNAGVMPPDLAVILTTDPAIIAQRLHGRGGHSRFEQRPDASAEEVRLYHEAIVELADAGWPLLTVDGAAAPDTIAETVAHQIMTLLVERSAACPA